MTLSTWATLQQIEARHPVVSLTQGVKDPPNDKEAYELSMLISRVHSDGKVEPATDEEKTWICPLSNPTASTSLPTEIRFEKKISTAIH